MFLLPERSKTSSRNGSKTVPNQLPKASFDFCIFLPGPGPPKTTRFGGCGWCLSFGGLALLPTRACSFFPWVVVCWCSSFGALGLLPALGCFSSLWWLWLVLSFGALELQPALLCWHFLWCSLLVPFD
jgi:hypothetical protein